MARISLGGANFGGARLLDRSTAGCLFLAEASTGGGILLVRLDLVRLGGGSSGGGGLIASLIGALLFLSMDLGEMGMDLGEMGMDLGEMGGEDFRMEVGIIGFTASSTINS